MERLAGLIAESELVRIVLVAGDGHQPVVAPPAEHIRSPGQSRREAGFESVIDCPVDVRVDVDQLLGVEPSLGRVEVEERQRLAVPERVRQLKRCEISHRQQWIHLRFLVVEVTVIVADEDRGA